MKKYDHTFYLRKMKSKPDVTPLCGIILLIIFIFALYLIYIPIPRMKIIDMPKSTNYSFQPLPEQSITIEIYAKDQIYIQWSSIKFNEIEPEIEAIIEGSEGQAGKILLKIDKGVLWGRVRQTLKHLKNAGIKTVGLITDECACVLDYGIPFKKKD